MKDITIKIEVKDIRKNDVIKYNGLLFVVDSIINKGCGLYHISYYNKKHNIHINDSMYEDETLTKYLHTEII